MNCSGLMDNFNNVQIERALEELRVERRRLIERIKLLIKTSPREAEIIGYLRGAENTSEAMLSLTKTYAAQFSRRPKSD